MRRTAVAVLVAALAVGACSSGDDEQAEPTGSTSTVTATSTPPSSAPSTTVPVFDGDPDSPFCALVAEGDERPVLDPFQAGLDAGEVELRLRNLRNRFAAFADAAPAELEADIDALVVALADTDEALATYDYDFEAMVEAGYTVGTFDDPVFEVVAFRLAQYRSQVCA